MAFLSSRVVNQTWGTWLKLAALSIALGLAGLGMFVSERKKPKDNQRTWFVAVAVALMVLGALTGLGGGPLWGSMFSLMNS
jgi:uncharacterized membrane protein